MSDLPHILTLTAALGCGVMAGFYFAFSAGVMTALGRLAPGEGIAAMQAINVAVINPFFLPTFLGTAFVSALAMVAAVLRWDGPGVALALAGGALYLVGSTGVTMAINVPLNNALAVVAPDSPEGAKRWAGYLTNWTAWNHLRTVASLAAMALFIVAPGA
jgi:uncharacterized membrane protein